MSSPMGMREECSAVNSGRAVFAVATLGAAALAGCGITDEPRAKSADEHWGLLTEYCVDCHNSEDLIGGIAFDAMSPENIPTQRETWEKVVRKLRGWAMPPPGEERPDEPELASFLAWLEGSLDDAARAAPRPGRVGLHRLNRREYANALRYLLGVEIDPDALLPRDNASEGFDNNASALAATPVFVEQFVNAARIVADIALGDPDATPSAEVHVETSASMVAQRKPLELRPLPPGVRDGIVVLHSFPVDGEYSIRIEDLVQGMSTRGVQHPNRIVITLDGQIIYETSIGGEEDLRIIDQLQDPGAESINTRLRDIRFAAKAGQREVAVLFPRITHAESESIIEEFSAGIGRGGARQEVLTAGSFEIRGPLSSAGTVSGRDAIFVCYPQDAGAEEACARQIVGTLATKAYRRTLSVDEMEERLAYYHAGKENGGFESGIRMALIGILASPHFLFRSDTPPDDVATDPVFRLADEQLASRIAFFLWSSVPDEELLAAAQAGGLHDPAVLNEQIRRMLSDPRAHTLATDFAFQWLQLDKMESVRPDPAVFPSTAGRLDPRADFRREITLFIDSIFREDRSILELLSARHTFVNETLAWRYGIEGVRGNHFRRVELEQPDRWGLFGKGAVLLVSSYPNRTSPVLRGDYVLRNIVGVPTEPPPPNVETNLDSVAPNERLTVRERLAVHSENPSCSGCHGVIDPLGFALEGLDVDGSLRTVDRDSGKPIDTSGALPNGTQIDGPEDLRRVLMERPEQFVQTFVEKLLTYALGRSLEWYDMPAVRQIVRRSAEEEYRFSSIVKGIVGSDPFVMREGSEDESGEVSEDEFENVDTEAL